MNACTVVHYLYENCMNVNAHNACGWSTFVPYAIMIFVATVYFCQALQIYRIQILRTEKKIAKEFNSQYAST